MKNITTAFSVELFKICKANAITCSRVDASLVMSFEYLNEPQSNVLVKFFKN